MEGGVFAVSVAVVVTGLVVFMIIKNIKTYKQLKEKRANAPKPEVFPNALKFGKYLSGHPGIPEQQEIKGVCEEDGLAILTGGLAPHRLARISYNYITNVEMEDQSTMERHVTATRMLTLGLFAFAAKKKTVHQCFYVIITWKDGQFMNETVLEFTGYSALQSATTTLNLLRSKVNKARM